MKPVEFRILGPLDVRSDGESLALGGPKQRALLAILLLSANRVVSRDRLIEQLWPDQGAAAAEKTLRVSIGRLRTALARVGPRDERLITRAPGYLLRIEPGELDLHRFERLVATGRQARRQEDFELAAFLLREAESLWLGRPLADLEFEPFARLDVERLEELRLAAVEDRIDDELELGRHGLVPELEGLIAEHPLRERLRAQLMRALYADGRQAEALAVYADTRTLLVDELGIEPGIELRELERRILSQDPALRPRMRAAPTDQHPRGSTPRRAGRRTLAIASAAVTCGLVVVLMASGGAPPPAHSAPPADAAVEIAAGAPARAIGVGSDPATATAGGGWLWTASSIDGTVSRVDPRTGGVQTLAVGAGPAGMTFGAGSLWVAVAGSRSIVRVNPRAAKVVARLFAGNGLSGLAYGGGAVWAAASVDGELVRVDAKTGERRRIPVGVAPGPVAYGAGGVWLGLGGAGTVARIDPRSGQVIESVSVGSGPTALAVGAGAVWVANADDGTVSRIDPRAGSVTATVQVGRRPVAIAVLGSRVWVAVHDDDAIVTLDARRATVVGRTALGKPPGALAVQDGKLWVTTSAPERAHRGGTLRVVAAGFTRCQCLDPRIVGYPPESLVLDLAYDGLVALRRTGGPAGAQLVGDLAIGVPQPDATGRTYVFRLRHGVRFADGAPLQASDVLASFHRLLGHPSTSGWHAGIVGARRCTPAHCDLSRGIVADDRAGVVTFHLERADPDFLYRLAQPFAFVLPRSAPEKIGRTPVAGTGPYRIERFTAAADRVHIQLARNPRFHPFAPAAAPDGYPDRIDFQTRPPPDQPPTTRKPVEPVLSGHADLAFLSDGTSITAPTQRTLSALAVHHAAQIHADPVWGTLYLVLNTRVAPFDDERVRQALNYAIDRRRVVALRGGPVAAAPTCQQIPPGFPGYRPSCRYTARPSAAGTWTAPDLARARRLVTASGTRGRRVLVWGFDRFTPLVGYVTRVLRHIGFRARAHIVDIGEYFERFPDSRTRAQIGVAQWTADYPAASNMLAPFFCPAFVAADPVANVNWSEFCDHHVEQAAAAARQAPSGSLQAASNWAKVDRRLEHTAAAVPLTNPRTVAVVSDRVRHYVFHAQFGPLLDQLWLR